jgi:PAS domain S-box-containing protein
MLAAPARLLRRRPLGVLLVLVITCLLGFTYASVFVQRTMGAYIRGESRWTHAQKDAVIHFLRFAENRDTADYRAAERALTVPRADRAARLLLERPDPDYAAATRWFVAGENDPADAGGMARIFPLGIHVPAVSEAVEAWRIADFYIDSLGRAGVRLATAVRNGDAVAMEHAAAEITRLDAQVTPHEWTFSLQLAKASRQVPVLVLGLGLLTALVLAGIAIVVSRQMVAAEEAALRAEHQRHEELRALVDDAPDVIARFDRELRHTYVNEAALKVTGLSRQTLIGMTHRDLAAATGLGPEFALRWEEALTSAFAGIEDVSLEFSYPDCDGATPCDFLCRLAPQRSVRGHIDSVISIGRDITALRQSEHALREREDQLRQAQKLEAVGLLAGGIAHEFNNILTAVIGNLELAVDELGPNDSARADIDEARLAAQRATGLTRQLLAVGRKQLLEQRLVDVNALVGELESMLLRLVGERVRLTTHTESGGAWVRADPGQLQQVLLNLVINARDAMPDGGELSIDVTRANGSLSPAEVQIRVRDTGIGMSHETRRRMFEPFFTTKSAANGSGLGLAVVHGIVAQSGGTIVVDTVPESGTAITVHLPAAESPPATQSTPVCPPAVASGTILLVEDEEAVRRTTKRLLERAGYRVIEAQHAEDGLLLWRRATDAGDTIDILVTDLVMPGRSGIELVADLRRMRPELPVLVVSGYTGSAVLDGATEGEVGSIATLRKPFTRDELLQRVREAREMICVAGEASAQGA